MKYVKQFFIITCFSFLGEVLNRILPLPIPASIYGIVLLFIGLVTGFIKLVQIRETAVFLLEIMPLLFVPSAAGLSESWGGLSPILFPVIVITLSTTVFVFVVSGHTTQIVIRKQKKNAQ